MYYCQDGQVVNLGFSRSNGEAWGLVSTARRTGDRRRGGDGTTPEKTLVISEIDRSHSYAPAGFLRLDTRSVYGRDYGVGVHDIRSDHYIGQRRSAGCIRTYTSDMRILRRYLDVGDPVTVHGPP